MSVGHADLGGIPGIAFPRLLAACRSTDVDGYAATALALENAPDMRAADRMLDEATANLARGWASTAAAAGRSIGHCEIERQREVEVH